METPSFVRKEAILNPPLIDEIQACESIVEYFPPENCKELYKFYEMLLL